MDQVGQVAGRVLITIVTFAPIDVRANARFNAKKALESVGQKQDAGDRINTHAALAISENKPTGITAADEAGYIIHEWQVLRDQARRMIT